jgi:hypothetical protein
MLQRLKLQEDKLNFDLVVGTILRKQMSFPEFHLLLVRQFYKSDSHEFVDYLTMNRFWVIATSIWT